MNCGCDFDYWQVAILGLLEGFDCFETPRWPGACCDQTVEKIALACMDSRRNRH